MSRLRRTELSELRHGSARFAIVGLTLDHVGRELIERWLAALLVVGFLGVIERQIRHVLCAGADNDFQDQPPTFDLEEPIPPLLIVEQYLWLLGHADLGADGYFAMRLVVWLERGFVSWIAKFMKRNIQSPEWLLNTVDDKFVGVASTGTVDDLSPVLMIWVKGIIEDIDKGFDRLLEGKDGGVSSVAGFKSGA